LQGIAQYNHLFSERLYSIVLVDALHDGIADLEYRVTVGPGVGYYFVKAEKTKFAGEIGGAFVEEKINPDPGAAYSQNYFTLRVADRFEHKFNDSAKVWQMTEWLPAVDDIASRYLLNTEVGAEAALTKAMSLRLVAAHRYNSQPAAGKKKYDLTLVASVAYKF
jgi:putative salt-induced outer membrane protein YdiY